LLTIFFRKQIIASLQHTSGSKDSALQKSDSKVLKSLSVFLIETHISSHTKSKKMQTLRYKMAEQYCDNSSMLYILEYTRLIIIIRRQHKSCIRVHLMSSFFGWSICRRALIKRCWLA